MLKIFMLHFPTERRLLQFRVQRVENGDLEFGIYAMDKVVYGKKCNIRPEDTYRRITKLSLKTTG